MIALINREERLQLRNFPPVFNDNRSLTLADLISDECNLLDASQFINYRARGDANSGI